MKNAMKNNTNTHDLYKAIGFTALLLLSSYPLSLASLELINFVFAHIPL
jgi:hypothetical protein